MNNLITFVKQASTQKQIVILLKHNDIFDYVRNYLFDYHNVDFTGTRFVNEQNILSVANIKSLVAEAIAASIHY